MKSLSQAGRQAVRLALVSCATLIAVAVAASGAGAPSAAAAAAPKVCREAGVTAGVVKKLFGASAEIGAEGVSESGRCAIQSGEGGQPPSNCLDGPPTCLNTDVTLAAAGAFKQDIEGEEYELNSYGHAKKTKFPGAGREAFLLTSTDGYAEESYPLIIFKAGKKTVRISGPFAGESQTSAVYKQWEALARKIYSHLNH